MHLSSGLLALLKVKIWVAGANLAQENLLLGSPVLRHLDIDSRTVLERNRAQLDETNCASVDSALARR